MKIADAELLAMYTIAGVGRARLLAVLRAMGRRHLSDKDMEWSESNPTRNYCYVVSEWVHRFRVRNSTPMGLEVPGEPFTHRFVIRDDGARIDLTCCQFRNYEALDYTKARRLRFMTTGGPQPSIRAQLVEHLYRGGDEASFVYRRDLR